MQFYCLGWLPDCAAISEATRHRCSRRRLVQHSRVMPQILCLIVIDFIRFGGNSREVSDGGVVDRCEGWRGLAREKQDMRAVCGRVRRFQRYHAELRCEYLQLIPLACEESRGGAVCTMLDAGDVPEAAGEVARVARRVSSAPAPCSSGINAHRGGTLAIIVLGVP